MSLKQAIENKEKEIVVKGRHIDVATAFSLFDKGHEYEYVKEVGACEFLYRLKSDHYKPIDGPSCSGLTTAKR